MASKTMVGIVSKFISNSKVIYAFFVNGSTNFETDQTTMHRIVISSNVV